MNLLRLRTAALLSTLPLLFVGCESMSPEGADALDQAAPSRPHEDHYHAMDSITHRDRQGNPVYMPIPEPVPRQ